MGGSTVARDSTPAAVDAATLGEALRRTAAAHPHIVAVRTLDDSVSLTWADVRERVDALARGLAGLGLRHGDTLALLMGNRPEFHVCDLAAVTLGATPFSIYQTASPEQIRYVVEDAGARVAIVEQAYLPALLEARRELPALEHVIVVDGDAPDGLLALADVEGSNPDFDVDAAHAEGRRADPPRRVERGRLDPRDDRPAARREGDLVAAGGAHR
jgi:long-subunit acyl-CoA synthetase (AMP-forming)